MSRMKACLLAYTKHRDAHASVCHGVLCVSTKNLVTVIGGSGVLCSVGCVLLLGFQGKVEADSY